MTASTGAPASGVAAGADGPVWHTLNADRVLQAEKVDEQSGLSSAEAASRAERFGPNKFDAGTVEPRWRAFLRQYTDLMQIVLLAAGVVSLLLQEWETGIVLLVLTLFNAVLGLQQEGKAAAAVAALQKMMIIKARVTRDGQLQEIPAEQLVPGDIVALEAGDVVPADGRLLRAATMEVAESALTGESLPVSKGTEPVEGTGTPLGDRTDMVYMNTNVTRGAGEFVVTATGMATEVTFSLYALFFSITTKDERRTVFSLDTFSDSKFVIATGVSVLTLLLTTVFGPLQAFLNTTSLDVRQWSVCLAVALSIVVVSEIRTAVRRHTAPGHQLTR